MITKKQRPITLNKKKNKKVRDNETRKTNKQTNNYFSLKITLFVKDFQSQI